MLYRECFQHLYQVERKRIVTPPGVCMRLNRGERPEPLPEEFRRDLRARFKLKNLQQYPSYPEFYDALSTYTGFPKENIVAGAGIEEFIRTLVFLCCDPGQRFAVLWPSCAMYDIYAQVFGARQARIIPHPGYKLTVSTIIDQLEVQKDLRLFFLPNPSQPVETCFDLHEMWVLADWCRKNDVVFAVDEAHFGFGAPTALPLVKEFDNVLVLRTFSKYFTAASIRVGFAIGQHKAIKPLDAARPSGEIAGPSMYLATQLMKHILTFECSAADTGYARDWLRRTMCDRGFKAYGSYGFSVLVDFAEKTGKAQEVAAKLEARGIYVKANFPVPIANCMLIACGSFQLMQSFYKEFEQCL